MLNTNNGNDSKIICLDIYIYIGISGEINYITHLCFSRSYHDDHVITNDAELFKVSQY